MSPHTHISSPRKPRKHSGRSPRRRLRILLFACSRVDVHKTLRHSDEIEIAFLPSEDLEEILTEIKHFRPDLVTCRTDFLVAGFASGGALNSSLQSQQFQMIRQNFQPSPTLTPREAKTLDMVVRGATNVEIARVLSLSTRTVKRTLSGLFERFSVSNRTELTGHAGKVSCFQNSTDILWPHRDKK